MAHPIAVSKPVRRSARVEGAVAEASTQEIYREILARLGEDPDRDGLLATPGRVEKSMAFLTKGYDQDPAQILRGALFEGAEVSGTRFDGANLHGVIGLPLTQQRR